MDRDFLKKMLRDQSEPLDAAAKRKLAYLESDDVFSETSEDVNSGSLSDTDISAMFSNAFATSASPQSSQSVSTSAVQLTHAAGKNTDTAKTTPSRHQVIADKIAALRGMVVDTDYMRRKRPDSSF